LCNLRLDFGRGDPDIQLDGRGGIFKAKKTCNFWLTSICAPAIFSRGGDVTVFSVPRSTGASSPEWYMVAFPKSK
jgi:hypothetical protein